MDPAEMNISDYLDVVRRRKWSIIFPFALVFLASLFVALLLPPIYKSTSTILIEEQDIPADFVMATVTSYADQRIQAINQRIMSSSRLTQIIRRFNLYADLRNKKTIDEVIAKMKADVKLEPISTEVVDRRTGRPTTAMIAFTLSYEGKETPNIVREVANVLASLFLEENLKVRARQTQETSRFLEDELAKLQKEMDHSEAELAVFKKQHINELPELFQVNQQSLLNIEREIAAMNEQIRSLREREVYLETQLASVLPQLEGSDADDQRLQELKLQLANLKSRVSDEYPDVKKLKAEIKAIEDGLAKKAETAADRPDNPAYITLASQLAGTRSDIKSAQKQLQEMYLRKSEYQQRIEATPKVDEVYNTLLTRRASTQAKYNDLTRKLMEARVAQGLEKGQKGERFTIIDPARLPEKPYKPNRLAIILIGFILGSGAGIGTAAFKEFIDDSVRDADTLARGTSLPVIAVIPDILTKGDILHRRIKRMIFAVGGVGAIVAGVLIFHFMVMDLNVFWARLMRRFASM